MKIEPPQEQIIEMVYGCRTLYLEGHNDINNGQISVRTEGGFWIKKAFAGWEETGLDDFVFLDLEGERLAGEGEAPAEWPLHAETYRVREDVKSIIHSHPPYAMVFGATNEDLQPISHDATPLASNRRFDLFTNTVTNPRVARQVAEALGSAKTMLLKNHGILTVGKSVPETVCWAISLENACRLQLIAASSGLAWSASPPEEVPIKSKIIFGSKAVQEYWAYWCRRVDRQLPFARG